MAAIAALPWNGLTVASTFSGCGGSCLGYRMAGYKVAWASEFIPAAQEVYRLNHPETILDTRDIRTVTADEILDALKMYPGELDLFDGSPPCASFSMAGKREKAWGKTKKYSDTEQRTDDLFFEYARLVKGLQPRVFVAENVKGLTMGKAKDKLGSPQMSLFDAEEGDAGTFYDALYDAGYRVAFRVLNAKDYGVPQSRARCIIIGVRNDLTLSPSYPAPLGYTYSVRDAIPWILATGGIRESGFGGGKMVPGSEPCPTIMAGGGNGMNTSQFGVEALTGTAGDGPAPVVRVTGRTGPGFTRVESELDLPMNAILADHKQIRYEVETMPAGFIVEPESDIARFAIGAEWDNIKPGEQSERYFSLVKPTLDGQCPTITASGGSGSIAGVVHPTEKRKFSIAELRRLCAFPDDFQLTGSYAKQWERLGRAVPPVMMKHIADHVAVALLKGGAR